MSYTLITTIDSPNYSKGRPAGAPNGITIHHWDDPARRPTFEGTIKTLCNTRTAKRVSAHYVAEAGRVACLVDPDNRAWHAGTRGNPRTIGIECNPRCSPQDRETVAELIANIRKTYGNLPLYPHKHWMKTACPGEWEKWLDWLDERATQINTGHGAPLTPAPAPSGLAVDGYAGTATITRLQAVLGTPQDGIISGQTQYNKNHCPRFTTIQLGRGGSLVIRALQTRLGVNADGYIGEQTVKAWQTHLRVTIDGYAGAQTVSAIQRALNQGRIS